MLTEEMTARRAFFCVNRGPPALPASAFRMTKRGKNAYLNASGDSSLIH